MHMLSKSQMDQVKQEVEKRLKEKANQALVISIMGQTGVGKSSLLNALFNTKLQTGAVRPTTMKPEKIMIRGAKGHEMVFWDLPGIGESEEADTNYLKQYRQHLLDSDVVLWAINADNRSTTFDVNALHKLIGDLPEAEQSVLMSRVTFVLTKADILTLPPWILASMGNYGIFAPDEKVKHILWEKELYYQQCFIQPYSRLIVAQTYNDVNFNISHPAFTANQYTIYYKGALTNEQTAELKKRYPQYAEVFDRLYDNYRVIACSALFKYNLHQLMLVILNKLGKDAIERFKNFVDTKYLDQVPMDRAKQLCNMVIFDIQHRSKIFDLSDDTFPSRKRAGRF